MNLSQDAAEILQLAVEISRENKYEYVTPETILLAMCNSYYFTSAFEHCGGDCTDFVEDLQIYLETYLQVDREVQVKFSDAASKVLLTAQMQAQASGKMSIEAAHIIHGIYALEESYAVYYLLKQGVEETEFLQEYLSLFADIENASWEHRTEDYKEKREESREEKSGSDIELYAPCINDMLDHVNPLIGREGELERTIQILCRKDKNNPLHIGEPGVGKTAITYGLARKIEEGKVPEPLKGARIYALDLGNVLAGTQYRGELEKRLKRLLEAISRMDKPIIYIDEIHNLAGAGAVGESSFDISNLLKPYLAQGSIRFIGATTFEEYKKYFEKNKSLARRFQNVEIVEPTGEETIEILKGLKKQYETFHGVRYGRGLLEYIVRMSEKHIKERFLPDKAIDLLDEAGAFRKIHPLDQKTQTVGKDVIHDILSTICHVPIEGADKEEDQDLSTLETRILANVFGQDEAVHQVVNAIKFARAGLLEDQKPLSSFLFAGPTGVGKTEIAKTLAKEMGVKLIRFDMSEYGEKHTIAKLIGSPAGYVGYEEGGLLTEAIRKNPSCVLLLDEIEKAHSDIYNVLLQVMDYATLTDNQGRKADFRNVVIILTSNAGASQIGKRGIGFQRQDVTPDIIMEEVKRIFQPEFRNRLNRIVVFRHMDDEMAKRIARKKLKELEQLLLQKKVEFHYSEEAIDLLREKGSSMEFGAREMDRILQNEIKPLLVDELLFGKLRKGGLCDLSVEDGSFAASFQKIRKR